MVSRNYCFTLHCGEEKGEQHIPTWRKLPESIKYMAWQYEICPTTKKLHIQGYMELAKPMRIVAAKEALGYIKAHLESRKGTQEQAINYCRKEESRLQGTAPMELGEPGAGRGKRTDLEEIRDAIEEGATFDDVREINFGASLRYERGIDRYIDDVKRRNQNASYWNPKNVTVYVGPSGVGKTRLACKTMPNAWIKTNGKWFIGYKGQQDVIIDEFVGEFPIEILLRILDGYHVDVEIKGGSRVWEAKNIWITSNLTIEEWYPNATVEQIKAIRRRVTVEHNDYNKAVQRQLDGIALYEQVTPKA